MKAIPCPHGSHAWSLCRICVSVRNRSHYQANREERNAYSRKYRAEHREQIKANNKRYQDKTAERRQREDKAWKEANPEMHRMLKYGVRFERAGQIEDQKRAQQGLCAICPRSLEGRNTHTDHCHTTGRFRALLCIRCNTGLGSFRDSPELLRAAADYIEYYRAEHARLDAEDKE